MIKYFILAMRNQNHIKTFKIKHKISNIQMSSALLAKRKEQKIQIKHLAFLNLARNMEDDKKKLMGV